MVYSLKRYDLDVDKTILLLLVLTGLLTVILIFVPVWVVYDQTNTNLTKYENATLGISFQYKLRILIQMYLLMGVVAGLQPPLSNCLLYYNYGKAFWPCTVPWSHHILA